LNFVRLNRHNLTILNQPIKRCDSCSFKEKWATTLAVSALFFFTIFFFSPLNILVGNPDEFNLSVVEIVKFSAAPGLLILVLIPLSLALLGRRLFERAVSLLLAASCLVYLQGNLFLWDYGVFDGSEIDWGRNSVLGYLELAVWLVGFFTAFLLARSVASKARMVAIIILLIQLGSSGFQIPTLSRVLTNREIATDKQPLIESSERSLYQLSEEKNVIIILLDGFPSPAFARIIERDSGWNDAFRDFTFFRNTLGSFPSTYLSVPSILTGETYDNSVEIVSFLTDSLSNRSVPELLSEKGFQSDLVAMHVICNYLEDSNCDGRETYVASDRWLSERSEILKLFDVVLFRHAPHFGKKGIYNQHSWFLQRLLYDDRGFPEHLTSLAITDSLEQHLSAGALKPTFKFVHLYLPHYPVNRNSDCEFQEEMTDSGPENFLEQAECALSLAQRIIDKIRLLGVYDNSLIFLISDHGVAQKFHDGPDITVVPEEQIAFPLLLVKPFQHRGPLVTSSAPASLIDLPKTITVSLGMDLGFPGESVLNLSEDQSRERKYFYYKWLHRYWYWSYLPDMGVYTVRGDVLSPASWKKVGIIRTPLVQEMKLVEEEMEKSGDDIRLH